MKALVQTDVETFEMEDVADPVPREGEVLVRVAACGICGSDMHAFLGHDERRPTPIVLGHEAAGTVVAHDDTQDDLPAGTRVTINPLVSCGVCEACLRGRENVCPYREILSLPPRPGAFAQFVAMPRANLVAVPHDISFVQASLVEPLACGWHAVRLGRQALDRVLAGLPCAVIGGGAIGVGAALALREQGADDVVLIEPNPLRREYLRGTENFRVVEAADLPDGQAALVVDAAGHAATRAEACRLVRPGGVIAHIGLGEAEGGLDVRRMTLQEITFIGTYTYTAKDFRDTAAALFEGRLGALDWTETRPLAGGQAAFEDIRNGRVAAPKIVLEPPEGGNESIADEPATQEPLVEKLLAGDERAQDLEELGEWSGEVMQTLDHATEEVAADESLEAVPDASAPSEPDEPDEQALEDEEPAERVPAG